MRRTTVGLWIALGGAVLQLTALGSNFYVFKGDIRDAWFGVPHTSDLILASAVVAILGIGFTYFGRMPMRGRWLGLAVGIVGLLATAQLVYRMIIPPFGCLQYACSPGQAQDVTLLTGIWIALAGNVAVTSGGFLHAFSRTARETPGARWAIEDQPGMNPWLGVAALGALAMFVFGFTAFTFYTVSGFAGQSGTQSWGGWLSIPHTSSLVLACMIGVLALVAAAARKRSPLNPSALGAVIAVLGFAAGSRIFYRMLVPPFSHAAGTDTEVGSVTVQPAGYLSLAGAVVVVLAGIAMVVAARERSTAAEPVPGGA